MCHFRLREWALLLSVVSIGATFIGCPAVDLSDSTVPDVVGLDRLAAYASLASGGFGIGVGTEERSDKIPEGCVIRQRPPAGSHASAGTSVNLVISMGAPSAGSIRVSLEPLDARQAGAYWRIDNGHWMATEQTLAGVSEGPHTVSFNAISGWQEPETVTVEVQGGVTNRLIGLYSQSVSTALFALADEAVPPEEAADDLYDAFNAHLAREGYDAAANAMDSAIQDYVACGGQLHDLTLRSAEIPSALYEGRNVSARRALRAQARSGESANWGMSAGEKRLARIATCKGTQDDSERTADYDNRILYVNGICITYPDFLIASGALADRVRRIDTDCTMHCAGYWNQDGLLLSELGECTAQLIIEWIDVFRDITVPNSTTSELQARILEEVDAGRNVIVVSHSQGNFHTREAVDDIPPDKRARINVLSAGSPVTVMPRGLRNCSRVDVEGDPVAEISMVNFDPFPYEGTWGWGDWLSLLLNRTTNGQLDVPKIVLLNHHCFEESYLQGEAGREIVNRIEDYLWSTTPCDT